MNLFGPLTRRLCAAVIAVLALGMGNPVRHVFAASDPSADPRATLPAVSDDLEAQPWLLVRYAGPAGPGGRLLPVLPGTEITATFRSGQVTGNAGCNDYNAGYRLLGPIVRLSPIASTRAACFDPPGIMQQEGAYFTALQQATRVDVGSTTLSLRTASGATLLEYVPQPQTPLQGTSWSALNYNNGRGAVVSIITGTAITATFDGALINGNAGCNSYFAPYSVNGDAITIEQGGSTMAFCPDPPGLMDQETAYLAALPTATKYRIQGALLILEKANGARVATYTAASASSSP
jgi:heat shock protein HslJ